MLGSPFDLWKDDESCGEYLTRQGVSRRQFLSLCGRVAAVLGCGGLILGNQTEALAKEIADKLSGARRPVVVWLQLQECTGCMESALRSGDRTLESLILSMISLEYNELLMAPSGEQAEAALGKAIEQPHLLVVNGSIPLRDKGVYCVIGGETAESLLRRAAKNASAVLAVGACAHYGCIQAAHPDPTGAVGVADIIKDRQVVNLPGCPPIGEVITATLLYYLVYGHMPQVDYDGRPLFAYGQRIHDKCPRRAHYDAGQFVVSFDDDNARKGYCLYKMGCKGPATFAPCPVIEWNLGCSFPIKAGHPCLGCTERNFFDQMTPFYKRLPGLDVPGVGVELTANRIGGAAVGASLAGVAVHSAATVLRKHQSRKEEPETLPLAALGEAEITGQDNDTAKQDNKTTKSKW
ncbi:MAG: hydrogenase small subunit [Desulfuromonadaceae bacterium]|nr:hydrogenase small subunit [Desulfuromonadaceae bacterium]